MSSSLYTINENSWNVRNVGVEKVKTITLNEIIKDLNQAGYDTPQLIVLDLQGAELNALKGADLEINQVQLLLVEVSKFPIYEGVPTFQELEQKLKEFEFLPIREFVNEKTGHGEIIYSRHPVSLTKSLRIKVADYLYPVIKVLNYQLRRVIKKLEILMQKIR